ncbi:MAG: hypothetical protein F6J89_29240, partial [Symploca sp. SIO1C4]|nr:hypothetical protein [Symploca sp. SIO1C4]
GFRIELGEIEAALVKHPAVRETLVLAREDKPGNKRLVAYVVANLDELDSNAQTWETQSQLIRQLVPQLRSLVKQMLPEYMRPSAFVILEALPLNPNGKVDRWALPVPDTARPELEAAFVAPRTPTEQVLAEIFALLLEVEQVGVHDDFFELGGHSLLATQLITQLHKRLEVEVTVIDLFKVPTVAGVAERIEMINDRTYADD